ncbi:hypothetical protein OFC17_30570, partial [Escherichia coli]|nr:hypothetical protein [Escherichia coli]
FSGELGDGLGNHIGDRKDFLSFSQAVVAHTFNPNTWEAEAGRSLEFKVSLVYIASSRTARAIQQRDHVSGENNNKNK